MLIIKLMRGALGARHCGERKRAALLVLSVGSGARGAGGGARGERELDYTLALFGRHSKSRTSREKVTTREIERGGDEVTLKLAGVSTRAPASIYPIGSRI